MWGSNCGGKGRSTYIYIYIHDNAIIVYIIFEIRHVYLTLNIKVWRVGGREPLCLSEIEFRVAVFGARFENWNVI